jgi:hypothetical protein
LIVSFNFSKILLGVQKLTRMPQQKVRETALLIERVVAAFRFAGLLVGVALVLRPFFYGGSIRRHYYHCNVAGP